VFVLCAWAACDERTPAPALRPGVVLEVDGLVIEESELAPLLVYVRSSGDRLGRSFATKAVLDRHVLPLRVAQREFAAERAALRAKAEAMRRSVMDSGGADPQLRAKGALMGGEATDGLAARSAMELVQADWCFDADNLGVVSPVLEVPRGFCLMSVSDHQPGIERSGDLVNAYQVPFYVHTRVEFETWWHEQKRRLRGKLTYVNPDYQDALPAWLKP
jgi:hypothetical protein